MHNRPANRVWLPALATALVAAVVVAFPLLGWSLSDGDRWQVNPVWFPAGVMLFAAFRWGGWGVAGAWVGSAVLNAQHHPLPIAAGIATGTAASYLVAAYGLRRSGFRGDFGSLREVARFLAWGVLLGPVASALIGAALLAAKGQHPWAEFSLVALRWWAPHATGVLVVAPAAFQFAALAAAPRRVEWRLLTGGLAGVAGVSALVFAAPPLPDGRPVPLAFIPMLAATGFAFATRSAAALAVPLAAVAAVAGTVAGAGPFVGYPFAVTLAVLWTYTGAAGLTAMLLTLLSAARRKAEAALVESVHDYRLLVDGSPTLICRYRADGRITFANDSLRGFVGDGPPLTAARLGLTAGGEMVDAEVECRNGTGRTCWLRWTSRAVGPDADGVPRFQAVGVDVTARREAENERRAIEGQLFLAQKLESLGVIAGGVAHDFNNILTGVMGNAELAGQLLPPSSPAAAYLARVVEATARAADLNRQLLAYAGKGKFDVRPLDLNDLLARTVDLVRLSLPKKVDVRLERWPRLPPVHGDESQLQQVLMNLLINAGDAIGDRPGTITLRTDVVVVGGSVLTDPSTGRPAKPGRYVTVAVSDTGCGMDEATKARIFEPFFTTKFTGRGLGLAAVQGIVRGHRGALAVETRVGRGTTFTAFLPEHIPEPAPAAPSGATNMDSITPRPNARRNTVLVVDDEDSVRELTAAILSQSGWNVVTAANGRLGVEQFRTNADHIACAILDLTMPEMDGMEAMAALRIERPRLPVLICTGYAEDSVPPLASNAPTGLLLKPFRPADLQKALADLFAASGGFTPLP